MAESPRVYSREWWKEAENDLFILTSNHRKSIIAFINGADVMSRSYNASLDGEWYGPHVTPMFGSHFEYQVVDNVN